MPIILHATLYAALGLVALGLWVVLHHQPDERRLLVLAAFAVAALGYTVQEITAWYGLDNHWAHISFPRIQGALLVVALTATRRLRLAWMTGVAVGSSLLWSVLHGTQPFTEACVQVSVFGGLFVIAVRLHDPTLRLAFVLYSLPAIMLAFTMYLHESQGAWGEWMVRYEAMQAGFLGGMALCAVWFWRSTAPRPPQLELWPA